MLRVYVAATLSVFASATASAHAIFIPDFSPGATVETFESLSPGPQWNHLISDGVKYADSVFLAVDSGFADFTNQQTPGSSALTIYASDSTVAPLTIDFSTPVDRAGLLLSSDGSLSWILVALDASFNVIDNSFVTQPGTGKAAFGGFENFAGISELRVQTVGPNTLGLFPHFDDLRYERLTAVPEPGTAALFGVALLGLAVVVRPRRDARVAYRR